MTYAQQFRIATYNIRQKNTHDTGNMWDERKEALTNLIKFHQFEIFGTQEGFNDQLVDMERLLPGFKYIGVGRDDGAEKGEYSEFSMIPSDLRHGKNCGDQFIASLNGAAETAVKEAAPVFANSLSKMTITDAYNILLSGKQDAATTFFKTTTTPELTSKFSPIVEGALGKKYIFRFPKDFSAMYRSTPNQTPNHLAALPLKNKKTLDLLVEELLSLYYSAAIDENGYVYATHSLNTDKNVPRSVFAHTWTLLLTHQVKMVSLWYNSNYQGRIWYYLVIQLCHQFDHASGSCHIQSAMDVITGKREHFLGADDKAGIAEIWDAARLFMNHPESTRNYQDDYLHRERRDWPRGTRLSFTRKHHKKRKFVLYILASVSGTVEKAVIHFIVRDHITSNLKKHEDELEAIAESVIAQYPGTTFTIEVKEQYRNMKEVLDQYPQIMEIGMEAIKRGGMTPERRSIRGGTDGSRLSLWRLPMPNIFAGGTCFSWQTGMGICTGYAEEQSSLFLHIAA
ncbi:hypothetical protein FQR65_LT16645 [Abscondita terminalis]|nr:hypothetical protein FQR65_LT16645 [Abscondita terminalis]